MEAFRQEYGKALNGECGRLYDAKYIFEKKGHPEKTKEFEKEFIAFAKTAKCKELINKKIPFCVYCIENPASFIKNEGEM